jgi:membrane associated rhomboid family serine protease
MFLHGNLLHIGGNMLYLWIFGDNVEGAMGHVKFLLFYLLSGVIAAFSQIAANPNSTTPMIGASGAIAGVLGAYFLLYPYSRVLTLAIFFYFIRLIELPAVFVLGLWFLLQLLNVSLGVGGGVAWLAHAGGFIAGALLVFVFKKRYVQIGLFRKYY